MAGTRGSGHPLEHGPVGLSPSLPRRMPRLPLCPRGLPSLLLGSVSAHREAQPQEPGRENRAGGERGCVSAWVPVRGGEGGPTPAGLPRGRQGAPRLRARPGAGQPRPRQQPLPSAAPAPGGALGGAGRGAPRPCGGAEGGGEGLLEPAAAFCEGRHRGGPGRPGPGRLPRRLPRLPRTLRAPLRPGRGRLPRPLPRLPRTLRAAPPAGPAAPRWSQLRPLLSRSSLLSKQHLAILIPYE